MKLKNVILNLAVTCLSVILIQTSCATPSGNKSEETEKNPKEVQEKNAEKLIPALKKSERSQSEKLASAESIITQIFKGIEEKNYAVYSGDFTDDLKTQITEGKFKDMNKSMEEHLGNYKSREYLGSLKKTVFEIYLWKAQFSATEDDVLVRLILAELDGNYKVFGIWFQ